jgi:plastocyanin
MSATLRRLARTVSPLLIALLAHAPAHAGEVRVTLGVPTDLFTPYVVNINYRDHVTWVWGASGHTVTNWTLPDDSVNVNFAGTIFDSDAGGMHFGQPSSTRFSWKSDRLGIVPYVCVPHIPDMTGRIIVTDPNVDPPVPVADFRISEVQYNIAGGLDLIEITNYGLATGNLGRYRITTSASTTELVGPAGAANDIVVPSGGRVVVHLNATGTNTNTDIFIASFAPGTGLPSPNGSLALYVPHSISPGNSVSNAEMIIDYVQWGSAAMPNEATASLAGLWGTGTFIPPVAAGHSVEYCPDANISHGEARWAEVATPNFGLDGQCLTPVRGETWGRVKTIYRN